MRKRLLIGIVVEETIARTDKQLALRHRLHALNVRTLERRSILENRRHFLPLMMHYVIDSQLILKRKPQFVTIEARTQEMLVRFYLVDNLECV